MNHDNSMIIFKHIIRFGKQLILPFLDDSNKIIFESLYETYYHEDIITSLILPPGPPLKEVPTNDTILLPVKYRIRNFLKEYIEENLEPSLITFI